MSLSEGVPNIDPELQNFIEKESVKQRFQLLGSKLTDQCWELCMGKPGPRLDAKTENCLVNCVERFIDTSKYICNRFQFNAEVHTIV